MFDLIIMSAIVICFSELMKKIRILSSHFIPILNIVSGIVLSVAYFDLSINDAIFQGTVLGLASAGIYSGVKTILKVVRW